MFPKKPPERRFLRISQEVSRRRKPFLKPKTKPLLKTLKDWSCSTISPNWLSSLISMSPSSLTSSLMTVYTSSWWDLPVYKSTLSIFSMKRKSTWWLNTLISRMSMKLSTIWTRNSKRLTSKHLMEPLSINFPTRTLLCTILSLPWVQKSITLNTLSSNLILSSIRWNQLKSKPHIWLALKSLTNSVNLSLNANNLRIFILQLISLVIIGSYNLNLSSSLNLPSSSILRL